MLDKIISIFLIIFISFSVIPTMGNYYSAINCYFYYQNAIDNVKNFLYNINNPFSYTLLPTLNNVYLSINNFDSIFFYKSIENLNNYLLNLKSINFNPVISLVNEEINIINNISKTINESKIRIDTINDEMKNMSVSYEMIIKKIGYLKTIIENWYKFLNRILK